MRDKASLPERRWTRRPDDPLAKTCRLSDGAVTSLLVGNAGLTDAALIEEAYKAFLEVRKGRDKAVSLAIVSGALGLLALLGIVSGVSSSGIAVTAAGIKPVALAATGLAGLHLAYVQARYSVHKAWFDWIWEKADAAARAVLLLRYPLAFDIFKTVPANRGWPPHMFPQRTSWLPLAFGVLALVGLGTYALVALAVTILLCIDVWQAGLPSPLVARAIVAGTALATLLSLVTPAAWSIRRGYVHYGLTNTLAALGRRSPARHHHFSVHVARISARMQAEVAPEEPRG